MDHTDYAGMFGNVDEVNEDQMEIEEVKETIEEVFVEEVKTLPQDRFVMVDLDPMGKLYLRSAPEINLDNIIGSFITGTVFLVLDDSNPEWVKVSTGMDVGGQIGYVKRTFVTDAPAPSIF